MFKKYSKSHNGEILEPKHIRNSLQQLNFGTIKELDFIEAARLRDRLFGLEKQVKK